jgi:hypothetical protein
MSTLDSLWAGTVIMVQNSDYTVLIEEKLENGWYRGRIIIPCTLGYSLSTSIVLPGNLEIWTII